MLSLARYYIAKTLHPGRADFIDMGLGIEARHRRCRAHWARHIAATKSFVEDALSDLRGERVALLGAGRLLDADPLFLLDRFRELHLFDADPTVLSAWRALRRRAGRDRVIPHLGDLTGALDAWTSALGAAPEPASAEEQLIRALSALPDPRPISLEGFDAIVSLNLLSQIPIYWRDRISSAAERRGLRPNAAGEFPPPLALAIDGSLVRLQAASLEAIRASGARRAVIVSDTDFYYYRPDTAPWQCERALFVDPPNALGGYSLRASDCWLWHLAPCGVEEKEYGAIHRVEAWSFRS